jgi:hypothetical protein
LRAVEFFAGTKSFSKVAEARGHSAWTTDFEARFGTDLTADIIDIELEDIPEEFHAPEMLWASPPCEKFTVMNIGRNWRMTPDGQHLPRNEGAAHALVILAKTLVLIKELRPKFWFIENPVDKMRSLPMMSEASLSEFFGEPVVRRNITQCQYGRDVMKPTDIWTNCLEWVPRPPCKNGAPCHERAPAGSKRGIQGKKGAEVRAIIPPALCEELILTVEHSRLRAAWMEGPAEALVGVPL